MRKLIITLCLVGSGLLILQSMGLFDSLMLLLTNGILPGTNATISPIEMLIILSLIAAGILLSITIPAVNRYITINHMAKEYLLKKERRQQKRRLSRA